MSENAINYNTGVNLRSGGHFWGNEKRGTVYLIKLCKLDRIFSCLLDIKRGKSS